MEDPYSIDTSTFGDNTYDNATLHVPTGTIKKYKYREGWKNFAHIVDGNGVSDSPTGASKYIWYILVGVVLLIVIGYLLKRKMQ